VQHEGDCKGQWMGCILPSLWIDAVGAVAATGCDCCAVSVLLVMLQPAKYVRTPLAVGGYLSMHTSVVCKVLSL
jgi:hypothetical protein